MISVNRSFQDEDIFFANNKYDLLRCCQIGHNKKISERDPLKGILIYWKI